MDHKWENFSPDSYSWVKWKKTLIQFFCFFHIQVFETQATRETEGWLYSLGLLCVHQNCVFYILKFLWKTLTKNGTGTWIGMSILPYQAPLTENLLYCVLNLLQMHYCLSVCRTTFHGVLKNRKICPEMEEQAHKKCFSVYSRYSSSPPPIIIIFQKHVNNSWK